MLCGSGLVGRHCATASAFTPAWCWRVTWRRRSPVVRPGGDAVNLASRIQGLTKELATDVLVSGTTRARVNGELRLTPAPLGAGEGTDRRGRVYALG
jgi:hypothetical protein